jgi:hypothetical protein
MAALGSGAPASLAGQFEQPYGPMGPPIFFTVPILRYMKTYGLTHEQLYLSNSGKNSSS